MKQLAKVVIVLLGLGLGVLISYALTVQAEVIVYQAPIIEIEQPKEVKIEVRNSKTAEQQIRERFKDSPILIEIARCESTFRQFNDDGTILRGRVDSDDTGVLQINKRYHLEAAQKLGFDIETLAGNMDYGELLYKKQGTDPWNASKHCWSKTQ